MYASVDIWVAIVLAGIAGCVATAFVANQLAGVPFNAVAGNVYKHIWSIILAIPIPLLLSLAAGVVGDGADIGHDDHRWLAGDQLRNGGCKIGA